MFLEMSMQYSFDMVINNKQIFLKLMSQESFLKQHRIQRLGDQGECFNIIKVWRPSLTNNWVFNHGFLTRRTGNLYNIHR